MKRVWKPLDIAPGLRLYQVIRDFPGREEWKTSFIVAASSPSHAARLIEQADAGCEWREGRQPVYQGYALNVFQPENWSPDERYS